MTPLERRLAGGVVAAWMILSICTSALRIGWRLSSHLPVYPIGAAAIEQEYLVQGLAAALLALYVWRNRQRSYRFVWYTSVAFGLFVLSEAINIAIFLPLRRFLPSAKTPVSSVVMTMVIVDLTHFFILALGAIAAALMIHSYRDSLAAEREAAAIEASVAEARVRNLRNQLRPAFIRESLQTIEDMLPSQPQRAESALLNLSDFLRISLLRTRRPQLPASLEAEYARLERDVMSASAS